MTVRSMLSKCEPSVRGHGELLEAMDKEKQPAANEKKKINRLTLGIVQ